MMVNKEWRWCAEDNWEEDGDDADGGGNDAADDVDDIFDDEN